MSRGVRPERWRRAPRRPAASRGFSLVEAMWAAVLVGVVIASVGYGLGLGSAELREERECLRRAELIQAKLAEIEGLAFGAMSAGADTVRLDSQDYIRRWTVRRADGNGDTVADPGLLLITVVVGPDSCQTLRCDVQ